MLLAALWTTVVLELLGVVRGLALVRPFGLVFPQWVPVVAKRRVPNWLLLVPSSGASVLLLGHRRTFVHARRRRSTWCRTSPNSVRCRGACVPAGDFGAEHVATPDGGRRW